MAVSVRGGDRGNKTLLTAEGQQDRAGKWRVRALDRPGGQTGTGWTDGGPGEGCLEAERKIADGQDYSGRKYSHDSLRESRPEKLHLLEIPIQERESERHPEPLLTLSPFRFLSEMSFCPCTDSVSSASDGKQPATRTNAHDMWDYTCSEEDRDAAKPPLFLSLFMIFIL